MSEKLSYEEIVKMYSDHMDQMENQFFDSGSHGWTRDEFLDRMKADQQLIIDYYKLVKPMIDSGAMYLN